MCANGLEFSIPNFHLCQFYKLPFGMVAVNNQPYNLHKL